MIDLKNFSEELNKLGIVLNDIQIAQFETYYNVLIDWNKKLNLTAITDKKEVFYKHFLDSIYLFKVESLINQTILDVGSGAGFPSIPLKIVFPDIQVTIVDALNKRIKFLEYLTKELEIKANLIHGRIEDFSGKESFDIVTARAVANLNMLSELCIPFVKQGGLFITLKGSNYDQELQKSAGALKELGVEQDGIYSYDMMGAQHVLIKFKKVWPTPSKYPRKFKKIKSRPL